MRRVCLAMVVVVTIALAACEGEEVPSGARVVADRSAFDTGRVKVEKIEAGPRPVPEGFLSSPIYRITSSQTQLPVSVEVRLEAPDSRWIVYYDEALRLWIPVPTKRDGKELVALVDHLSHWSTIKDGVDWLSIQMFRLTGNRTDPPSCSGTPPAWVSQFDAEPGDHPRLLACHGGGKDEATVALKNNRGYPLWVTFSDGTRAVVPSHLEPEWPSSFEELIRLGFGAALGTGRTYLGPRKQVTATFAQPESPPRTGRVETHATIDAPLVGFHVLLEILSSQGLVDIPLPGGKMLGVGALECYAKVPWATIGLSDSARLLNSLNDLRECFALTVADDVKRLEAISTSPDDAKLQRLRGLSRLLLAINVTNWFQQFLDAVLLDAPLFEVDRAVAYLGFTAREPFDWSNFTYDSTCDGLYPRGFTVELTDGRGTVPSLGAGVPLVVQMERFAVGDLSGGPQPETAVLLNCWPGGNYSNHEIQIFEGRRKVAQSQPARSLKDPLVFLPPELDSRQFDITNRQLRTGMRFYRPDDSHAVGPRDARVVYWEVRGDKLQVVSGTDPQSP